MDLNKLIAYVNKGMGEGDNISVHLPGLKNFEIVKLRKHYESVTRSFLGYVEFRRKKGPSVAVINSALDKLKAEFDAKGMPMTVKRLEEKS